MSVGQGSILVQQKKESGGGGGTVTGANNGVSLNGTNVVLGNVETDFTAPGALTGNQVVVLNGSTFAFLSDPGELTPADATAVYNAGQIDLFTKPASANKPTVSLYQTTASLILQALDDVATLGDISVIRGIFDKLRIGYGNINAYQGQLVLMQADANFIKIGDVDNAGGGLISEFKNDEQTVKNTTDNFLTIQPAGGYYALGHISGANGNTTQIEIDDINQVIRLYQTLSQDWVIDLDIANKIAIIGETAGVRIWMQGGAQKYFKVENNANDFLNLDFDNNLYQLGDINSATTGAHVQIDVTNQTSTFRASRFSLSEGVNVAAANNLTLPAEGNVTQITGNTQINAITTNNWQAGSVVHLVFTGSPTVKHNTAGGAGTAVIKLDGETDMSAAPGATLTLCYINDTWKELCRSFTGADV